DTVHVVEWDHHLQTAGLDLQQVELLDRGTDCPAADLLDDAHPMVRVNDLVADAKAVVIHEGRAPLPSGTLRSYERNGLDNGQSIRPFPRMGQRTRVPARGRCRRRGTFAACDGRLPG